MTLYCDMDGVLADFDAGYEQRFGVKLPPRQDREAPYDEEIWANVRSVPDFFLKLPPMPDMQRLWDFIGPMRPVVLTGVPKTVNAADNHKRDWALATLSPQPAGIICCKSREKALHCRPGDILIDDWTKYRDLWEAAGGTWVTHRNAERTICKLLRLGF